MLKTGEMCMYKIGEFAGIFGLSIKTLRIYDHIGLLKPAYIDKESGYRYYMPEQVQALNVIIELKSIGFSLKEIKEVVKSGMDPECLGKMLDRKLVFWRDSITAAQYKVSLIKQMKQEIRHSNRQRVRVKSLESDDARAHRISKLVCQQDNHADRRLTELLWL
jgi:DNA-binding transcriptional MerR regulator